jgi:hypothetical protein
VAGGDEIVEEVVDAVNRVVAPSGVLAVDRRKRQIRLRPGVPQLAARIEATLNEMTGGTTRRVSVSGLTAALTGTERAFASEVGGLARVALVFPAQFAVPKDLVSIGRATASPAAMAAAAAASVAATAAQNAAASASAAASAAAAAATTASANVAAPPAAAAAAAATLFERSKQSLRAADAERISRLSTGASLLKQGESILADDEESDERR